MQRLAQRLALAVGLLANVVTSAAFLGWMCAASGHAVVVAYAGLP